MIKSALITQEACMPDVNYWLVFGSGLLFGGWLIIGDDLAPYFLVPGAIIILVGAIKFLNKAYREMKLFLGANFMGFLCGRTAWSYLLLLPEKSLQEMPPGLVDFPGILAFTMGYLLWIQSVGKRERGSVWIPRQPDPPLWKLWRLNIITASLANPHPESYMVWTLLFCVLFVTWVEHIDAKRLEEKKEHLGSRAHTLNY